MKVLALDLGLNVGWASGSADTQFESGAAVFSSTGQDIGRMLFNARTWFIKKIEDTGAERVVVEAPIHVPTNDLQTLEILYQLGGMTALCCKDLGLPYKRQRADTVRLATIGFCRAPTSIPKGKKRPWLKAQIVGYCIARGWNPETDHAADALLQLEFAIINQDKAYAARNAGPLLTAGR